MLKRWDTTGTHDEEGLAEQPSQARSRGRRLHARRCRRKIPTRSRPVPCSTARGKESARQNAARAGLTNPSGRLVMRARAASVLSVAFLDLSFLVSLGA